MPATDACTFASGEGVVIFGLSKKPELNGTAGQVQGAEADGRYPVRLKNGSWLKVKPDNLRRPNEPERPAGSAATGVAPPNPYDLEANLRFAADAANGAPAEGPFDRIIAWAAYEELPRGFVDQLSTGGIMVAAIGSAEGVQVMEKLAKLGSRLDPRTLRLLSHRRQPPEDVAPRLPGATAALSRRDQEARRAVEEMRSSGEMARGGIRARTRALAAARERARRRPVRGGRVSGSDP